MEIKKLLTYLRKLTLNATHSARNIGFIFDEHLLAISDQISSLS